MGFLFEFPKTAAKLKLAGIADRTLVYAVPTAEQALQQAREDAPDQHPSRAVQEGVDPFNGQPLWRVHFIENDPSYDPDRVDVPTEDISYKFSGAKLKRATDTDDAPTQVPMGRATPGVRRNPDRDQHKVRVQQQRRHPKTAAMDEYLSDVLNIYFNLTGQHLQADGHQIETVRYGQEQGMEASEVAFSLAKSKYPGQYSVMDLLQASDKASQRFQSSRHTGADDDVFPQTHKWDPKKKESQQWICTKPGCNYVGTEKELEEHTKDHEVAEYSDKSKLAAADRYMMWVGHKGLWKVESNEAGMVTISGPYHWTTSENRFGDYSISGYKRWDPMETDEVSGTFKVHDSELRTASKTAAREDHVEGPDGRCVKCGGQWPCHVAKEDKRMEDWDESIFGPKTAISDSVLEAIRDRDPNGRPQQPTDADYRNFENWARSTYGDDAWQRYQGWGQSEDAPYDPGADDAYSGGGWGNTYDDYGGSDVIGGL